MHARVATSVAVMTLVGASLVRAQGAAPSTLPNSTAPAISPLVAPPVGAPPATKAIQPSAPPLPLSPAELDLIKAALATAPDHGLAPTDPQSEPTVAILAFASALHGRRIAPAKFDPDWALRPDPFDAAAEFQKARTEDRLKAWLDDLAPTFEGYHALMAGRAFYAGLVANGGWEPMDIDPGLKLGVTMDEVEDLRTRLTLEGFDAAAVKDPRKFDKPLDQAVRRFQVRHGLPPTGVGTADTIAALNISAEADLAQIDANLERWRWLPRSPPADRITVNIPAAALTFSKGDEPVLTMRVVVGNPDHRTPTFAAKATAVVFNPAWHVPSSIAAKEIYPKEARHPGYFRRNGFSVVGGQLVQAYGPSSALGHLKIDLDDPFAVYLHDTPSRGGFTRATRNLSHGCIRMQHPDDVAALLLGTQDWKRDDVTTAIAAKVTKRVGLKSPYPVFIVYRSAIANSDQTVTFLPDIYGWDTKLNDALAGRLRPTDAPAPLVEDAGG